MEVKLEHKRTLVIHAIAMIVLVALAVNPSFYGRHEPIILGLPIWFYGLMILWIPIAFVSIRTLNILEEIVGDYDVSGSNGGEY